MKYLCIRPVLTVCLFTIGLLPSPASEVPENLPSLPRGRENIRALTSGRKAPNSAVWTQEGKHVSLKSQRSGKSTLYLFVEGSWSPLSEQLLNLIATEEVLQATKGLQVVVISPEAPKNLPYKETPKQLKAQWISDQNRNAAKAFGIAYHPIAKELKQLTEQGYPGNAGSLLCVPSLFLCDVNGIILDQWVINGPEDLAQIKTILQKKQS